MSSIVFHRPSWAVVPPRGVGDKYKVEYRVYQDGMFRTSGLQEIEGSISSHTRCHQTNYI